MPNFYRAAYHDLVITLSSDKMLGFLTTGYLQNYSGLDGYITLRDQAGVAHDMPMAEVALSAEPAPHEVFTGSLPLSTLPDGQYSVQCRVKDIVGNYTIVGAVASPIGTETVEVITFAIINGVLYVPSVALTASPAPGVSLTVGIVNRSLVAPAPNGALVSPNPDPPVR